jgi:hypothetical protein
MPAAGWRHVARVLWLWRRFRSAGIARWALTVTKPHTSEWRPKTSRAARRCCWCSWKGAASGATERLVLAGESDSARATAPRVNASGESRGKHNTGKAEQRTCSRILRAEAVSGRRWRTKRPCRSAPACLKTSSIVNMRSRRSGYRTNRSAPCLRQRTEATSLRALPRR